MAFGLSNNAEQKAKDQQAKTIKDSITKSEDLLTGLLNSVQKKCRKEASLRDASDVIGEKLEFFVTKFGQFYLLFSLAAVVSWFCTCLGVFFAVFSVIFCDFFMILCDSCDFCSEIFQNLSFFADYVMIYVNLIIQKAKQVLYVYNRLVTEK